MLAEHLKRVDLPETEGRKIFAQEVYAQLGEVFTIEDLSMKMAANNLKTRTRQVVYIWSKKGLIEDTENEQEWRKVS